MREISEKYRTYAVCLILTVVTLAVFWQVHTFDFVNYDDDKYVSGNEHISSGFTLGNIKWLFTKDIGRWHPLTGLTHMLDCELFGLNPGRHHLVNLFFHIINILLLFALLRQMTGAFWQSAFVTALFAIHPLHVESVAWISGRKDLLSGLFFFLTIAAYLRYVKNRVPGWYVLALVLFALGLLAKPMLITLPFILLLLDYWPLQRFEFRIPLRLIWEKLPFFILSIGSTAATYFAQKGIGAVTETETIPLSMRVANAVVSYIKYIGKTAWPENLAVFYPYPATIPLWHSFTAAILLVIITICVIRFAGKFRYLPVGWLWFIGTLVPVTGLVRVGEHSMADRYTYVSLIGVFLIIAWGASDLVAALKHRKTIMSLLSFVIVLVFAICSHIQTSFWRNSRTLFEHAIKVTTGNYPAHLNLGAILLDQNKFDQAIEQFQRAIQINPTCAEAYYNLGVIYFQLGRYQETVEFFKKAIKINPDNPQAFCNLGVACEKLGLWREDAEACEQAVKLKPDYFKAHYNLGIAYMRLEQYQQAIQSFEQAVRIKPDYKEAHYGLGLSYVALGEPNSALEEYKVLKTLDAELAENLLKQIPRGSVSEHQVIR